MTSKTSNFRSWLGDTRYGQLISFLIIISIGIYLPLPGAILILLWRYLVKLPFRNLGLLKPGNWLKTIALGIVLGVFLKLLFKSVIMPLVGAEAVNGNFEFLQGNLSAALSFGLFALVSAGFCEELVFRGYLFTRLEKWLGSDSRVKIFIIVLSSVVFGLPHIYQGASGAIQAGLMGLIIGSLYYINHENLWLLVVTHASFDLLAIYLIYAELDKSVAGFFF